MSANALPAVLNDLLLVIFIHGYAEDNLSATVIQPLSGSKAQTRLSKAFLPDWDTSLEKRWTTSPSSAQSFLPTRLIIAS